MRIKSAIAKALILGVSFTAAFCIVEIGLRLMGFSYPQLYMNNEATGTQLRPGACGWVRREGEVYVRINRDGLRDREHLEAKPPATYRIAVLGDSFAEAVQVRLEETFWSILETRLNVLAGPGSGRRFEVINFGVSGFGTAQELMMLRSKVWRYQPDLVLLAFCTGNDVRNNSSVLEREKLRPFFILDCGRLLLDDSFRHAKEFTRHATPWSRRLRVAADFSRTLQLCRKVKATLAVRQAAASAKPPAGGTEMGLDDEVMLEPNTPAWREAWEVTEGILSLMAEEIRDRGADFLVVTLSNSDQVHPDTRVRDAYLRTLGTTNLFYPDQRLARFGATKGIPVLNLAPHMAAVAEQTQEYLHGFSKVKPGYGHWNAKGHALAGSLIADRMWQQLKAGQPMRNR